MVAVDKKYVDLVDKMLSLASGGKGGECTTYTAKPGEEGIIMIWLDDHLICSVEHALSLSDEALAALVKEKLAAPAPEPDREAAP